MIKKAGSRQSEDGNVIYLTVMMIMILAFMTLGLVNVIQTAVIKMRAQQAVDHMVLSVANLKAQCLNENANYNSVIMAWLSSAGTPERPYNTVAEAREVKDNIKFLIDKMESNTKQWDQRLKNEQRLDFILEANGLDQNIMEIGLMPKKIGAEENMATAYQPVYIKTNFPPYYQELGLVPAYYEPKQEVKVAVQARVEWNIKERLIGQKLLPTNNPTIVVKARAQLYDDGVEQSPLGRCWKVRLVKPDYQTDEELKAKMPE